MLKHTVKNLLSKDKRRFFYVYKNLLGFPPNNLDLYKQAFIQSSSNIRDNNDHPVNNERLEYLGDAVLSTVISDYLYKKYSYKDEGFLSKMRSKIISREHLSMVAEKLELYQHLIAKIEQEEVLHALIGNALEALIGAIMIDHGYEYCHSFIYHKIITPYIDLDELASTETNFKGSLIEWAQKNNKKLNFETTELEHDDTNHIFQCVILLDKEKLGSGTGKNKKDAQQHAAEKALSKIIS